MVYMKYVLNKMGWFPKWERGIEDVLSAASMVDKVRNVVTPRGRHYYYVMLNDYNIHYVHNVLRLFRANGVILRPHKSHNYGKWLFRTPNHGQQFMCDVMRVNKDVNNFEKVLDERGLNWCMMDADVIKQWRELKWRQR